MSQQVVEALLNNETYFFRDRAPFDLLAAHALPELAERRAKAKRLRIWSAGCSTGQEVYSLAMLFAERPGDVARLDDRHPRHRRVDARASIARAHGTYSQFEVQRGLGINQMIQLVRGMRRRLARGRGAAPAGPLPGPQFARAAAASRAGSTSSCAATSCSTSAPRRRRWRSSGSPAPWPRTAG